MELEGQGESPDFPSDVRYLALPNLSLRKREGLLLQGHNEHNQEADTPVECRGC